MTAQLPATQRAFRLERYTPEAAWAIEDHWLKHMPHAGKSGMGKLPGYSENGGASADVARRAAERRELIYAVLEQGPKTAREVAEIIGVSRDRVSSYISDMRMAGRICRADNRNGGKYRVKRCSLRQISAAVAAHYDIRLSDLMGVAHARRFSWPRQLGYLLSHDPTDAGMSATGAHYRRDHTTVIHGIRSATRRMADDMETGAAYNEIAARLRGDLNPHQLGQIRAATFRVRLLMDSMIAEGMAAGAVRAAVDEIARAQRVSAAQSADYLHGRHGQPKHQEGHSAARISSERGKEWAKHTPKGQSGG